MENPISWMPAHWAIMRGLEKSDDARRRGVIGASPESYIFGELRQAGLLTVPQSEMRPMTRIQRVAVGELEIIVVFTDGRMLFVPTAWYPRLKSATPLQRNTWRLVGGGVGVHWPDLDEDLSAEGFLLGQPGHREVDTVGGAFLAFLAADLTQHTERLRGMPRALLRRALALTRDISIDHDTAIEGAIALKSPSDLAKRIDSLPIPVFDTLAESAAYRSAISDVLNLLEQECAQ